MTYTTEVAYSDAYRDAINEFTDDMKSFIPDLVASCCAGQWRENVWTRIQEDDALVTDFLREALARLDSERQNRPSAQPLKGAPS